MNSDRRQHNVEKADHDPMVYAFVSTFPGEGKTTIAGAVARTMHDRGAKVGVMVPVALNCKLKRAGLVSADSELLAHYADSLHDLATIAPYTFPGNRPPHFTNDNNSLGVDLESVMRVFQRVRADSELVLIEAHGGLLFPIAKGVDVADLLKRMEAQLIIVASASADAINDVLMNIAIAQSRGLAIGGIALNNYDPDQANLSDEMNPEWIERIGRVGLPLVVPHGKRQATDPPRMDDDILAAVRPAALSWLSR